MRIRNKDSNWNTTRLHNRHNRLVVRFVQIYDPNLFVLDREKTMEIEIKETNKNTICHIEYGTKAIQQRIGNESNANA